MRRTSPLLCRNAKSHVQNLIQIENGTFYRKHPGASVDESTSVNSPLFSNLTFDLPAATLADGRHRHKSPHWAVIGPSATTFLEVLRGSHICIPPNARKFPYLSSDEIDQKDHRLRAPSRAIQYVGFGGGKGQASTGVRGAYLSARYESRREETDWSVLQYLKGDTELNPAEARLSSDIDGALLSRVLKDLRLESLVNMPVSNLSNGQTRRSRIARALLGKPELLLLDEPFMGLDPPTLVTLSPILRELAYRASPLLLMALRPQDPIPDWITHLAILGTNNTVALKGPKAQVLFSLHRWVDLYNSKSTQVWAAEMANEMTKAFGEPPIEVGHTLTSRGIQRYDTYDRAKAEDYKSYFNWKGDLRALRLSNEDRVRFSAACAVRIEERTLQDWLTITTTLPKDFQSDSSDQIIHFKPATANSGDSVAGATLGSEAALTTTDPHAPRLGAPLIELDNIIIKYGTKIVLGHAPPGLNFKVRQGTRLLLLGPNGSGKTTLLSLLTSDHPHSYSLPIKFFGRTRLPRVGVPGLSLWEIQNRTGHSSPEVHGFFPKHLTVRQVLESAWAETYAGVPKLIYERDELVDTYLRWWEPELRQHFIRPDRQVSTSFMHFDPVEQEAYTDEETGERIYPDFRTTRKRRSSAIMKMLEQSYPPFVSRFEAEPDPIESSETTSVTFETEAESSLDWADDTRNHIFGVLPFGTQRLLLLLRAMIKEPDILILDEAFSGLGPEVREKAMCWLEDGESMFLQRRLLTDEGEVVDHDTARFHTVTRPPCQPGRSIGRPPGSTNRPKDNSPYTRTIRRDGRVEKLWPRWEITKVPNMRKTVQAICESLGEDPRNLTYKGRQRKIYGMERNALMEAMQREIKTRDDDEDQPSRARRPERQDPLKDRFTGLHASQAMVVVSHVKEEVPSVINEWLRLPGEDEVSESGKDVQMGRCEPGWLKTVEGWAEIWGL